MNMYLRERDGAPLVDGYAAAVESWEFIASGEASESPYHQWRCAFYLGRAGASAFALQLRDIGDPDTQEDDGDPFVEVVAVATDADEADVDAVVRALFEAFEASGGKYIEMYHEFGEFDLNGDAN